MWEASSCPPTCIRCVPHCCPSLPKVGSRSIFAPRMDPGKSRRWWLPGPPPPRRLISLHDVEESYRLEGIPELAVPVRTLELRGGLQVLTAANPLAPYIDQLDRPGTDAQGGSPVATLTPLYLFHGCGEPVNPEVIRSFARWGPSIRFSRSSSYFSPRPAVYWTNSIEFAIAWSFFARTGSWGLDGDQLDRDDGQSFECLIFVSKLDLGTAGFDGGLHMIPRPQTVEEEEELAQASLVFSMGWRGSLCAHC
ncbi:hypothetical protein B0J18DRAFT_191266 [Chaetomium sp. MPI-SDFR-AT-0129]|nr:hypothetical protein B0J18DRAFT_191266 [Chaetomium sp. MPI-SDFR-AT-0129]